MFSGEITYVCAQIKKFAHRFVCLRIFFKKITLLIMGISFSQSVKSFLHDLLESLEKDKQF